LAGVGSKLLIAILYTSSVPLTTPLPAVKKSVGNSKRYTAHIIDVKNVEIKIKNVKKRKKRGKNKKTFVNVE